MRSMVMGMLVAWLLAPCAFAEQMLDDFESYRDGEIVGATAQSEPWRRFGNATIDNIVATAQPDRVLAGRVSGQYVVRWPGRFGSARFVLGEPSDFTDAKALAITLRSDAAESGTVLRLAIADGETSYVSRPMPITAKATLFVQPLEAARFERASGEASFAAVLKQVKHVGFNVTNDRAEGEPEVTETLIFDDLRILDASDAVPTSEESP